MTKIISAIFCFSLLFSSPAEAHTRIVKQCHIVHQYVPAKEILKLTGPMRGEWVVIPAHYRKNRVCKDVVVRSPHRHVVTRRTHRHHHHRHPHRVRFGVRINL